MKKLFLAAAMTVLIGSFSTVFATGENTTFNGDEGTTLVKYSLSEGYTITIPGEFSLTPGSEIEKQVSAEGAVLSEGKTLNVSIKGANCQENRWYISDENNSYVYELKKGSAESKTAVENNSVILSVPAGTTEKVTTNLYFSLGENTVTKAGTYSDTLTFTVSVD